MPPLLRRSIGTLARISPCFVLDPSSIWRIRWDRLVPTEAGRAWAIRLYPDDHEGSLVGTLMPRTPTGKSVRTLAYDIGRVTLRVLTTLVYQKALPN